LFSTEDELSVKSVFDNYLLDMNIENPVKSERTIDVLFLTFNLEMDVYGFCAVLMSEAVISWPIMGHKFKWLEQLVPTS